MKKIALYAFLIVHQIAFYTSCCTKQDCDLKVVPQVIFKYGDENMPSKAPIVYLVDKEDFGKKDSLEPLRINTIYSFSEKSLFHFPGSSIKDFSFVIKSSSSLDTIFDITYENIKRRVDCNTCFLADGSAIFHDFKDFSYQHKGHIYYKEDTLILRKQ